MFADGRRIRGDAFYTYVFTAYTGFVVLSETRGRATKSQVTIGSTSRVDVSKNNNASYPGMYRLHESSAGCRAQDSSDTRTLLLQLFSAGGTIVSTDFTFYSS